MSKWKELWDQYQSLHNQQNNNWNHLIHFLARYEKSESEKNSILNVYDQKSLCELPSEEDMQFLKELAAKRQVYDNNYRESNSGIHEDVYALAIHLTFAIYANEQPAFDPNDTPSGIAFRGTRNSEFILKPSIQRPLNGADTISQDEKDKRARVLAEKMKGIAQFLDSRGMSHSPEICMAIAQHYGTPSPLIDLTSSIWVALFFATDRSPDIDINGHVGVVDIISLTEYSELQSLFEACSGSLRIIDSLDVPRINNQRGCFVEMPSPSLNNLMVNQTLRFYQKENVYFECPHLGISKEFIYPSNDDYADIIPVDLDDNDLVPPFPDYEELSVDSYYQYGNNYLLKVADEEASKLNQQQVTKEKERLLMFLCMLHCELQTMVKSNEIELRKFEHSLARFRGACSIIYNRLIDIGDGHDVGPLELIEVVKAYSHSSDTFSKISSVAKTLISKVG